MRSTRIETALASPRDPGFEPQVPPRFRKSAHSLSAVFKHDSSLSKQAYKTRERLARCSSLEMRRLHGLMTSFRAERSNAHKATLPGTSASREVPASRCTEAPPARMQASRLAALLFGTRVDRTNGRIECRVRRCAYRDSYALRPHQRAASGRSKPSAVPRVSGFITRIASY